MGWTPRFFSDYSKGLFSDNWCFYFPSYNSKVSYNNYLGQWGPSLKAFSSFPQVLPLTFHSPLRGSHQPSHITDHNCLIFPQGLLHLFEFLCACGISPLNWGDKERECFVANTFQIPFQHVSSRSSLIFQLLVSYKHILLSVPPLLATNAIP